MPGEAVARAGDSGGERGVNGLGRGRDGAGSTVMHLMYLEKPDVFTRVVLSFFDANRDVAPSEVR